MARRTENTPERAECAEQSEDSQYAEDLGTVGGGQRDDDVEQRDEHETAVHHVPAAAQVRVTAQHETLRDHLHHQQPVIVYFASAAVAVDSSRL